MTSVQQLHKAGLLTIALFSSNLWGDASGDSDYAANTQHDDSDSSSDCGSNASGDEQILTGAHAAKAHTAEAHAAEARATEARAAKAHATEACAADSEEHSDDEEAADEEEGPCGSSEWCTCSLYDIHLQFNSLHTQGRTFC